MTRGADPEQVFTAPTIEGAVTQAIAFIVLRGAPPGDQGTSTLMFSGEAVSAEAALGEALEDIRVQCVEHRCTPVDVVTHGVMGTDTGTRIWGAVLCLPGMTTALPTTQSLELTIAQEAGQWLLTIRRR